MAIQYEGDTIVMSDVCSIEDAEELQRFLETHSQAYVKLTHCEHMHTALLQLLMQYNVTVRDTAYSPFLWKWVVPLLNTRRD